MTIPCYTVPNFWLYLFSIFYDAVQADWKVTNIAQLFGEWEDKGLDWLKMHYSILVTKLASKGIVSGHQENCKIS